MSYFYKFPSTPHIAVLDNIAVRGDKVLSEKEREEFLRHEIIVEEKIDGANLGISFDHSLHLMAQNRGNYLVPPYSGQWKRLTEWLQSRTDLLFEVLGVNYILFGEWCYAQHSIKYDRLPDWFVGFDIFDKQTQKFFSSDKRNSLFDILGVSSVPKIAKGTFSLSQLSTLLEKSCFSDEPAEGLYLRVDTNEWLQLRAKLVRKSFVQNIEQHWSQRMVLPNKLA